MFQLVRAPGVCFHKETKSRVYDFFNAEVIPKQGTWIDFVTKVHYMRDGKTKPTALPLLELSLDKSKTNTFFLTDLLTIFGLDKKVVLDLFNHSDEIVNSYNLTEKNFSTEQAINRVYNKLFSNVSGVTVNFKLKTILNFFFNKEKFLLSGAGRYKFNHKLFIGNVLLNRVLAEDLIDYRSKKINFKKGTLVTKKVLLRIKEFLFSGNNLVKLDFAKERISGSDQVQVLSVFEDNDVQDKIIKLVGINPNCDEETLSVPDIVAIAAGLLNLSHDIGRVDDIDSLANRNIRTLDELLSFYFTRGLEKIVNDSTKKLDDLMLSKYNYKIVSLVNSGLLIDKVREFFNVSQLCQFLDQTNPLTELSNKRRVTILGESGLKRESASAKVRDIHSSYAGKICPIETPEGPNIGLITNLAFFASLNKWNFLQTPHRKVKNGVVTKKVVYLSALEEEGVIIAPATTPLDSEGKIINDNLQVYLDDNLITVHSDEVEYLTYSCKQMFSISTSCVPFLKHNDANRALMGANMQKQAVPLINSDSPIVGTGNENLIARDSGFCLIARNSGEVIYADSEIIKIKNAQNKIDKYLPTNFLPSNQRTALFHKLLVKAGDKVEKNQIIADGSSIQNGELAIGKNVLVAFTTWRGYNFEDAVIVSDRLVREDVFTSLHIEEYEIRRLRTSFGDKKQEKFTNQIPNTSEHSRRYLDEEGVVLLGSEVRSGDILVGKVTPKEKAKHSPEDILLNNIFHGREQHVENNSLVVPNGGGGIVQKIKRYSEKEYATSLSSDVIEVIKVFVVQKIYLKEGDKLANRHGNKGVISRILPENSMPYLSDGTAIDIMINPLGVPSRMNVGQLLEMHLSYASKKLGNKISTPIFNGANVEDLKLLMAKAKVSPEGKETLYDGETGVAFDRKIAVGMMYYLKLSHMVETKIHARNVGPYGLITQQPLKGKAQNGGQRFGEMEVWALESYGAAYNLQELLTIKSDDVKGRNNILYSIIENDTKNFTFNHYPESFNVLLAEMRSLCLNVEILRRDYVEKKPTSGREELN